MVPPAGWIETDYSLSGSGGWELDPFNMLNGLSSAWHDDFTQGVYNLNGLASPTIDCSGETGVYLEWMQDNVYPTWIPANDCLYKIVYQVTMRQTCIHLATFHNRAQIIFIPCLLAAHPEPHSM